MQLFERIQASAIASAKVDGQALKPEQETSLRPASLSLVSLRNYALAGACAALLLALVELADIHVKLSPVFASLSERLIITAYFSLNLLSGALIGALVWLAVILSSMAKSGIERVLPRRGIVGKLTRSCRGLCGRMPLGESVESAAVHTPLRHRSNQRGGEDTAIDPAAVES